MEIEGFDHVAIRVRDLEASQRWYETMFGLQRRFEDAWQGEPVVLCAGDACLALFQGAREGGSGLEHIAFRLTRAGLEQAKSDLRARGIAFRPADHGVSRSVYLHDPDGYEIELTTYEVS
jgi:catechol-2,3-dioxygenase